MSAESVQESHALSMQGDDGLGVNGKGALAATGDGTGWGLGLAARPPIAAADGSAGDGGVGRLAESVGTRAGLVILIVDDNSDSADSMAMLLRMKGHCVHVAYGGEGALARAAHTGTVDLALLDIAMPGADGFTVLQQLKKTHALSNALFAAMTGFGQASDVERSLSRGFDMHLTKPVQLPLIDALLQRAIERRKAG
ncbi:MAG TPA: response regulator [Trinickia sp.]|uniref:response regulator n=1 Tax=Trinickia sp. TaxID=2571163 RepID=UPI002B8E6A81|nr:response regulator [Trinickia sp.]HTI18286.1 response regulator [Trinickia sp.]